MPRRPPEGPFRPCTQTGIHFFQRSVKSRKRPLQPRRPLPHLHKIAVPELTRASDRSRPHRTIFVRPFCPDHFRVGIDPQRKSHK